MSQFPETVGMAVELGNGAVPGPVVGRVALVAPAGGSDLNAAEVIKVYSGTGEAIADRGSGSKLAVGAEHVLGEGHATVITIAPEQSTVNYTFGDGSALADGDVPDADVPLTSITSATKDSVAIPAADIVYLESDAAVTAYVFTGSQKMAINMVTGKIKLSSATSGLGAGLVLVAVKHDWAGAFEILGEEDYEYIAPAGYTYEAKNAGVWSAFLTHAVDDNKMLAAALPSGATVAVHDDFVLVTREGRLSILAVKEYTGDGTSAYVGYRAKWPTNAQIKLQPAPRTLTITKGYTFGEYGGHKSPASGTWHNIGVNAVFKHRGAWLISASRASTGLTVKDRFDYLMRIVREVQEDLQATLTSMIQSDPSGNGMTQGSLDNIFSTLDGRLRGFVANGRLSDTNGYSLRVPAITAHTTSQIDNGEVGTIEVRLKPNRQIGYFDIKLKVE